MPDRPRHVLVYPSPADGDSRPHQGLLIEWQQRRGDWWAHVAVVTADGHLVVTWRHESALRPT